MRMRQSNNAMTTLRTCDGDKNTTSLSQSCYRTVVIALSPRPIAVIVLSHCRHRIISLSTSHYRVVDIVLSHYLSAAL